MRTIVIQMHNDHVPAGELRNDLWYALGEVNSFQGLPLDSIFVCDSEDPQPSALGPSQGPMDLLKPRTSEGKH